MTDPNAQPPATLEEAQAALANLDPKLARILRRHLGLAPAEPEPPPPSREPEQETSVRAALREQLSNLDPNARAFDPEALRQLDAEIAEKARAQAEQEAAEAAKHADAAKRERKAITTALEPLKARARRLSPVKRRMIESAVKIEGELPEEVIYQHSVFCQMVLPYRDPGPEVRKWERVQGKALLQITAGEVADKRQQKFIPVGLPHGPAARLLLVHLNTTALQTQNPVIEVEGSMTAYIRRLTGHQTRGADIQRFKEQLVRLSACLMRFAFDTGPSTHQTDTKVIDTFDLWEEYFDGQCFLFPQTIALSGGYFQNLLAHAVPLDERAVAALAHSAMALDVYMWLAQRLHRVDPQRGQFIPWTALQAQFGQGYQEIRKFRRDFKTTLNQVLTQYPAARVKTDKGGMLIGQSPPPVPQRSIILLSPTKPAKG